MTGGPTRGQGRKIITKIEREVNDRRKEQKGLPFYTTVDRLAAADRERQDTGARDERSRWCQTESGKNGKGSVWRGGRQIVLARGDKKSNRKHCWFISLVFLFFSSDVRCDCLCCYTGVFTHTTAQMIAKPNQPHAGTLPSIKGSPVSRHVPETGWRKVLQTR